MATKLSGRFVLENHTRLPLHDGFVMLLPEQAQELLVYQRELEAERDCLPLAPQPDGLTIGEAHAWRGKRITALEIETNRLGRKCDTVDEDNGDLMDRNKQLREFLQGWQDLLEDGPENCGSDKAADHWEKVDAAGG